MKRNFYNIQAKSDKEVDIYIYGLIGYGWWDEGNRDAFEFVQEFKNLEKNYDRINVRINSPGGIVDEGLPIYNVIKSSQKDVHTYIDGIAYSMGAIIALAGKTVHAAKNSLFLLHNVSGWGWGNANDFRDIASNLDTYDDSLITSLTDKTGLTNEQIRSKWFDYKDHLMTAQKAKDDKLIDVIEDTAADIPEDVRNMTPRQVFNMYVQNAMDSSKPGMKERMNNWISRVINFSHTNKEDMDPKKLRENLNLDPKATDQEIEDAVNQLIQQNKDLQTENNNLKDTATGKKKDTTAAKKDQPEENADLETENAELRETVNDLTARIEALENADGADTTRINKAKDKIDSKKDEEDADLKEINAFADKLV